MMPGDGITGVCCVVGPLCPVQEAIGVSVNRQDGVTASVESLPRTVWGLQPASRARSASDVWDKMLAKFVHEHHSE